MVRSAGADAGAVSDWEQLAAMANRVTRARARAVRFRYPFLSEVIVFGVNGSSSVVEIRALVSDLKSWPYNSTERTAAPAMRAERP